MEPANGVAESHPPAAEVDAAFAVLSPEARTAILLAFVVGVEVVDIAETIGITAMEASLLVESGTAEILEHLRRRGWDAVRVDSLGALLLETFPEPPPGLFERILERCGRYLRRSGSI